MIRRGSGILSASVGICHNDNNNLLVSLTSFLLFSGDRPWSRPPEERELGEDCKCFLLNTFFFFFP